MHLIFRTSWIYATRGRNFLLTILRLASEREELRIVHDQIGAPTCAADIAVATTQVLTYILQRNSSSLASELKGTYHVTAAGETTWYDFAEAILDEARTVSRNLSWFVAATQGRKLMVKRVIPIRAAEFPSPADRPGYSVLSNLRLTQTFGIALPDWRDQLQRCFISEAITSTLFSS